MEELKFQFRVAFNVTRTNGLNENPANTNLQLEINSVTVGLKEKKGVSWFRRDELKTIAKTALQCNSNATQYKTKPSYSILHSHANFLHLDESSREELSCLHNLKLIRWE